MRGPVARLHRGRNGHPDGTFSGLGTSPSSTILCWFLLTFGSGTGTALISETV